MSEAESLTEYKPSIIDKCKFKVQDAKYRIQSFITNIALSIIRRSAKDSNYVKRAKAEFVYAGYTPTGEKQEDGPNLWIQQNIIDLLSVLSTQGHSGGSIGYCVGAFKTLAMFEPLTPIKCTDDEWDESFDGESQQNKRLSSVFRKSKGGKPYYLNAIVWKNQNGICYGGSAISKAYGQMRSSQYIKLPFTPKTFYVDVIEEEVEKDSFEFYVKDDKQLEKVFEYYGKKE